MVRRPLLHLAPTAAVALTGTVAAIGLGLTLGEGRALSAAYSGPVDDSDADGLSDVAEMVALTSPDKADTDGDGFSDLEELARGTDPSVAESATPAPGRAIGISATADGAWVRTDVAFYLPDGDFQGLALDFGAFAPVMGANGVEGLKVPFPPQFTYGNGTVDFAPGAEPGSLVIHFDVLLPQSVFEALTWVPLYATLGEAGQAPTAAAAQTIVFEADVLMSLEVLEPESGYASTQVGGIFSRPIEPEENLPTSLSTNQVCVQAASPIGGSGGLVELIVDEAQCVDADFLFCPTTCAALVGSSRTIVDPLALIGG